MVYGIIEKIYRVLDGYDYYFLKGELIWKELFGKKVFILDVDSWFIYDEGNLFN